MEGISHLCRPCFCKRIYKIVYHIRAGFFGLWTALLLSLVFLSYKTRILWPLIRSTSLPPTYTIVMTECLVCLVAVHSGHSFPLHIMVFVCLVPGRRSEEDERSGITIDTLAYLGGQER